MTINTRTIGRWGEAAAAQYLESLGYEIVGRNVYAGGYEADLLARNDTHFVFAEVKTRRESPDAPDKYGRPYKAVTSRKQAHMLAMAKLYLKEHPEILETRTPRVDVIEVYLSHALPPPPDPVTGEYVSDGCPVPVLEIRHFPGAVRKKYDYGRTNRYE